jgi:HEAT repeat protein
MDEELQSKLNSSITELIGYLADDDAETRLQVLMALTRIDDLRAAAEQVPRLFNAIIVLLFDANPEVRTFAAILVGRFDDSRGVEPLLHSLTDTEEIATVRNAALVALMEFSELPAPVVAQLRNISLELLQTVEDDEFRATAAWVLGRMPYDVAASEALSVALDDRYEWVRKYAEESLALFAQRN